MAQSFNNDTNSDDLIAELARLMAEDAQGSNPADAQKTAPTPEPAAQQPNERIVPSFEAPVAEPIPTPHDHGRTGTPDPSFAQPASAPYAPAQSDFPAQQPVATQPDAVARPPAEPSYAPIVPPVENAPQSFGAPQELRAFARNAPVQNDTAPVVDSFASSPIEAHEPPITDSRVDDAFSALTDQLGRREQLEKSWSNETSDPIADLIAAQEPVVPTPPVREPQSSRVEPVSNAFQGLTPQRDPTPANLAPRSNDPLDEIENLIGEAVRAGTAQGLDHVDQPSQTVKSSGVDDAALAAEASILAASQAAGQVQTNKQNFTQTRPVDNSSPAHVAPAEVDTQSEPFAIETEGKSNLIRTAAPAIAALVLLFVGVGVFFMFNSGTPEDGEAPILAANTEGAKVEVQRDVTDNTSVVVNELDGTAKDTSNERIVSRDQTDDGVRKIETTETDSGLANRKVRTVTVRPDGTIVSSNDAVAGTEVLPIDRPNVPELPNAGTTGDFQVSANTTPPPADTPVTTTTEVSSGVVTPPINGPIPQARIVGRTSVTTATPVVTAPTQNAGTTNQSIDLLSGGTSAPVVTTAPAAVAPTTVASSAPAFVQLSSQRSDEAARSTLSVLQSRFSNVINTSNIVIRPVDLADRGTFYRVLLPANSVSDANTMCANLKNAGGDCFVRTN